jgi:gas vesicle protein
MDKSTGKAVVGFIFGAAVGVAAGMLFAPRSGVETRKKIEKKAREYSDDITKKVGDKIDDLKGHMNDFANEAKARVKKASPEEPKA